MSQASNTQARSAASPPRPMIAFDDIDVVVGGRSVLHKLSWELRPDEHWGIVGTNGSGKTTFLKLVAGTLSPAGHGRRRYALGTGAGVQPDAVLAREHITLVGHELQDRYRRLGWNFTSYEVVLSGVFRTDIPRREPEPGERERALALLDQLGALALAERPFLELSRGQQRRVLIARGLAFEPRILLLDEPAAGLDTETRRVLYDAIDRISESTTVIFSAHEAHDLPRSINRIARLAHGKLQYAGPFSWSEAQQANDREGTDDASRPAAAGRVTRDTDASAAPVIDVKHANVWFEDSRILTDITWQLRDGEHWLVRGRNGAGKSTFLRLLHGQFRPATGGYIRWPAIGNPRSVWTLRRQIAWVSPELQAAYLYPTTVRACVASGIESSIGLMKRPSADEAAWIETLLREFELQPLAERPVSMLSYGQMRRVLVARALVNRPRVLLLDEPWEGLDTPTMQLMHAHLARIISHGTQLVCASHLDREIGCFTHEVEIDDGQIVRVAEKAH